MRDSRASGAPGDDAAATLVVVGAFAVAVLVQTPWLNGPWYWTWPWRALSVFRTAACFAPAAAVLLHAARRIERSAEPFEVLPLLGAAAFLMQAGSALAEPLGLGFVPAIVASPGATSYYTDALLVRDLGPWLDRYEAVDRGLHSSTHPPGPILYYYCLIRLVGPAAAAAVGGWLIAMLACAGVPLLYAFARLWTEEAGPRLWACAVYAALPGLAFFFPELDQVYPLCSMAMVLLWTRALEGRRLSGAALGAVLFAGTFFAYNLLTVGALMAFLGLRPTALRRLLPAAALPLAVAAALYALLGWATGFDPLAAFRSALAAQARLAESHGRPYLASLGFDLYDFLFIGSGALALPLLVGYARRATGTGEVPREEWTMTRLALASVLVVDLTGLLRTETARVWLFLQPFAVVPVGLELARRSSRARWAILAAHLVALAAVKSRMTFIQP